MREIGPTLREARIRSKIDVSQVEAKTKIRAKYLRALENEEWDLLPGPAYVRSFLKTYAQYLGLDAQLLVDEYRRTHEREAGSEAIHYGEPLLSERHPVEVPRIRLGRGAAVLAAVAGLFVFLLVLGLTGGAEEAGERQPAEITPPPLTATEPARTTGRQERRTAPSSPSIRIRASGAVWVCLVDASGKRLIDAQTLPPGADRGPYRSRRFLVTFGNGQVSMLVGRRTVAVPDLSEPIGYRVTATRVRRLPEAQRPTCT